MKILKNSLIALMLGSVLMASPGCFGSFEAVKGLYGWNDGLSESRWVKSLVLWGLVIIPVYQIFAAGDIIIFNLIEFWGGSNPLAMNDGDVEMKIVENNGEQYKYVVTKDQYQITQLTGEDAGTVRNMRFDRETSTWMYTNGTQDETALLGFVHDDEGNDQIRVYTANGYSDFNADEQYDTFAIQDKLELAEGEAWVSK